MHDKQDDESENDIGWEELDQDYWEQSPSGNKDDIGSSRHLLKHGTNWGITIIYTWKNNESLFYLLKHKAYEILI